MPLIFYFKHITMTQTISDEVMKEFGYDEDINLAPMATNIGLAFNDNLKEAIEKTITLTEQKTRKEIIEKIIDIINKAIDKGHDVHGELKIIKQSLEAR